MDPAKIKGGYILLARQLLNSDIWRKPPEYLKIFIYILLSVNHKDTSLFLRGSNLFNFSHTKIKGVSQNQIYDFLKWARNSEVITTENLTRGMVVKVNNYERFQVVENYKNPKEFKSNSQMINKEREKNVEKEYSKKECILSHVVDQKKPQVRFEREFTFSSSDYEILKSFAKKHSKNCFWGYLRSLVKDIDGAQEIIAEEKRRAKILKNNELDKLEKLKGNEKPSALELEIKKIKTKDEALNFIVARQENLKFALFIPQYKSLAKKFNFNLYDLEQFRKNSKKRNKNV